MGRRAYRWVSTLTRTLVAAVGAGSARAAWAGTRHRPVEGARHRRKPQYWADVASLLGMGPGGCRAASDISGTFVVALIAGVLSYIFLMIVGLGEHARALAVLVAVLDIIPLIAATLAAVVVNIGFSESVTIGIAALTFYALYQ